MLQLKDGITNHDLITMYALIENVIGLPEEVFNTFSALLIRDKSKAKEILIQISKERG